jgi:hypothetical protein
MAQSSSSCSSSDDSFSSSSKCSSSAPARGALFIDVPPYAPRQPPKSPSAQRTASDPITPSSSRRLSDSIGVFSRSSNSEVPKFAGHKSSRSNRINFGSTSSGEASPLSPSMSPTRRPDQMIKRRYSHEPKVNVYTECGRHGDDVRSNSYTKLLFRCMIAPEP